MNSEQAQPFSNLAAIAIGMAVLLAALFAPLPSPTLTPLEQGICDDAAATMTIPPVFACTAMYHDIVWVRRQLGLAL